MCNTSYVDFNLVSKKALALAKELAELLEEEIPAIQELKVGDLTKIKRVLEQAYELGHAHGHAHIP